MRLPRAEFERLVEEALSELPEAVRGALVNVSIEVRDRPGPEAGELGGDLLGLYFGPTRQELLLPEGPLPPGRVVLYQRNLEATSDGLDGLRREIVLTLRHELAHHFGLDDEELRRIWPEGA